MGIRTGIWGKPMALAKANKPTANIITSRLLVRTVRFLSDEFVDPWYVSCSHLDVVPAPSPYAPEAQHPQSPGQYAGTPAHVQNVYTSGNSAMVYPEYQQRYNTGSTFAGAGAVDRQQASFAEQGTY